MLVSDWSISENLLLRNMHHSNGFQWCSLSHLCLYHFYLFTHYKSDTKESIIMSMTTITLNFIGLVIINTGNDYRIKIINQRKFKTDIT